MTAIVQYCELQANPLRLSHDQDEQSTKVHTLLQSLDADLGLSPMHYQGRLMLKCQASSLMSVYACVAHGSRDRFVACFASG